MRVVNLEKMFAEFTDHWKPHVVGQVNDCLVKLVKFQGPFVWHHHATEDEMFLVVRGSLRMHVREWGRESEQLVGPGEFIIIPRQVEHMPVADEEVHVILFEPQTTVNTGNAAGDTRTITNLPTL